MVRMFSLLLMLLLPLLASAGTCKGDRAWALWQAFQRDSIQQDGRVIDHSDPRAITTSEGQAYAMFFALVDNDRALFDRLLGWTERELASNDLSSNLPAWLWGRAPDGQWRVLDSNAASDADLWMAYALLEAGRLWNEPAYERLGSSLAQRIAEHEVVDVPHLGTVLLPGPDGFVGEARWVLNPSYMVPQLYDRLAQAEPDGPWQDLRNNLFSVLSGMAPDGWAPDWAAWHSDARKFRPRDDGGLIGSYDAIRVYLWIGMLARGSADAARLTERFASIGRFVSDDGSVAERIDLRTGRTEGRAPLGFTAALQPLLRETPYARALARRVEADGFPRRAYYDQVLGLFAEGWMTGRYRFDARGYLRMGGSPCW